MVKTVICNSPIRWAGGKRLLIPRLREFVPESYGAYYEPMVGSGALYFSLKPQAAYLGDINSDLVNFYRVLRTSPIQLYLSLRALVASGEIYYRVRAQRPRSPLQRAVRFFYLIRLCWNGLYRVNRRGHFNVPFNGRRPKALVSLGHLLRCSEILRSAKLVRGDLKKVMRTAQADDFAYFDPPYPRGALRDEGFARYTEYGFSHEAHERLATFAATLADRGVHVLVTIAARREFLQLYSTAFHVTMIRNRSLIAGGATHRRDAYEAILTSYACAAHQRSTGGANPRAVRHGEER